jgi:hypothetical protein
MTINLLLYQVGTTVAIFLGHLQMLRLGIVEEHLFLAISHCSFNGMYVSIRIDHASVSMRCGKEKQL